MGLASGRSQPWTSEHEVGARREQSRRALLFAGVFFRYAIQAIRHNRIRSHTEYQRSETAEIDEAGARAAPGFRNSLAAIGGRRTVVAMVAGDIVPVAGLRRF